MAAIQEAGAATRVIFHGDIVAANHWTLVFRRSGTHSDHLASPRRWTMTRLIRSSYELVYVARLPSGGKRRTVRLTSVGSGRAAFSITTATAGVINAA